MFKPIINLAAAAAVAGVVALALSVAPAATGHAVMQPPQPSAKADFAHAAVKGTACSRHAWPDFEPKCQFDLRESAGKARIVRVLALR